jgi:hypothetical protein
MTLNNLDIIFAYELVLHLLFISQPTSLKCILYSLELLLIPPHLNPLPLGFLNSTLLTLLLPKSPVSYLLPDTINISPLYFDLTSLQHQNTLLEMLLPQSLLGTTFLILSGFSSPFQSLLWIAFLLSTH